MAAPPTKNSLVKFGWKNLKPTDGLDRLAAINKNLLKDMGANLF